MARCDIVTITKHVLSFVDPTLPVTNKTAMNVTVNKTGVNYIRNSNALLTFQLVSNISSS